MCFAIPYKIISIKKNSAVIEGGRKIRLGKELKASSGDYIQAVDNIAVNVLSKKDGDAIRKLIASLNS